MKNSFDPNNREVFYNETDEVIEVGKPQLGQLQRFVNKPKGKEWAKIYFDHLVGDTHGCEPDGFEKCRSFAPEIKEDNE